MSKDGKRLFSQSLNQIIEFKINNDQVFEGHEGYINNILLSNCNYNEKLYTCSRDCTARVFNINSGECENVFMGHKGDIYDIQLNNENTVLFTCSQDHTCKSYNILSGKCINTFSGHTSPVRKII